jgi:phage antirepressor YoqD-like protein
MHDLIPVPFRNATLFLADVDGIPYAPMKPIVEGMGLDWSAQFKKLSENKERWGIAITAIPSGGGQQDAICLPLRKLPGWLMTIQPTRVKPEIRETVIAYQNECDDALWDYWSKGRSINPRSIAPEDYPSALRALADEAERRQMAERELEAQRPKVLFHDQVTHDSDTLIDWAQAFSLLKRRTGQSFTARTFLDFLRRHGVACQPNIYANIGRDRFKPRKDYINTWFVSELTGAGGIEWMMRPYAISEIVRLIEKERTSAAMVAGYLEHGEDAA